MSVPDRDSVRARFEALSRNSFLEVILPKTADFDVATVLKDGSYEDVQQAPPRRHLFFDERIVVTAIARTAAPEAELRGLLPNLELSLAAHATNAVPESADGSAASASGKYDLVSRTMPAGDSFDIVTSEGRTFIIWKTALHIARPRVKLNRPAIYFTASLLPKKASPVPVLPSDDGLLEPFATQPINVLEPLRHDPNFASGNIHLSEKRITKVSPTAPLVEARIKPLRGASKRAFPVVPAVFTRLRSTPVLDAVIVSLHLEASPVVTGTIYIRESELKLQGATIEPLAPNTTSLQLKAGDEIVLLHKVTPTSTMGPSEKITLPPPLDLRVKAALTLDGDSEQMLDIRWQSPLDLSRIQVGPKYKWSRPLSTLSQFKRLSVQSTSRGKSSETVRPSSDEKDSGVLFNFTAPSITRQDSDLMIQVQCINHSNRTRRFGIVVLPPSKPQTNDQASTKQASAHSNEGGIAAAIAAPWPEQPIPLSVIDLNPDLRIGPLPPGACFETKMKFRILVTGVLTLGTFRIVDLDSRQTVDVKEVPDVISLPAKADDDDDIVETIDGESVSEAVVFESQASKELNAVAIAYTAQSQSTGSAAEIDTVAQNDMDARVITAEDEHAGTVIHAAMGESAAVYGDAHVQVEVDTASGTSTPEGSET